MPFEPVEGDPFAGSAKPNVNVEIRPASDTPAALPSGNIEPVEGDPYAPTASGMAKAYGVGVAQGVIGVPGMAGDISQLLSRGGNWAAERMPSFADTDIGKWLMAESAKVKPGVATAASGDLPGSYQLPTSQDIQGTVESAIGPFREPQNQAERDAATAGQFTGSAFINPGGLVRKGIQAAVPATADIIAGRYSDQNPYVKALAGMIGGVATGAALAPGAADRLLSSKLPSYLTEQHITDAGQLIDHARQRGVNLTWPEALSQVTGQPILTDLQRILESHPQTRAATQAFMAPRAQQVESAARAELSNISPPSYAPSGVGPAAAKEMQGVFDEGRNIINKISEPYYNAAEGVRFSPQEWHAISSIPNFEDMLHAVRSGPNAWRIEHLPDNSVGVLNAVKKEFNARSEASSSKFNPQANQETASTFSKGAEAAKQIGTAKSSAYEEALGIQQTGRDILDRVEHGPIGQIAKSDMHTNSVLNILFKKTPDANSEREIRQAVSLLASRRPQVAEEAVRLYIENTLNNSVSALQSGGNQFAGAKLWKELAGHPQRLANLRAAVEALPYGKERWNSLQQMLEVMEATGKRQAKGSLTAFNALDTSQMSSAGLAGVVANIPNLKKWQTAASDALQTFSEGKNLDRLTRIILDPRSAPVFRRLMQVPAGSDRALEVVGRLLGQVTGVTTEARRKAGAAP